MKKTRLLALVTLLLFSSVSLLSQAFELRVLVNKTSLYLEPDTNSQILATVDKDTILNIVMSWKDNWYYVSFKPEKSKFSIKGFVESSNVEKFSNIQEKQDVAKVKIVPEEKIETRKPLEIQEIQSIKPEDTKKDSILQQIEFPGSDKEKKNTFLLRVDYFSPTKTIFKDIYNGGINYGGEIIASLWKGISISFGASVFSKKGKMTPFGDETTITIIPVELGILYKFSKTTIKPYLGAGLGYYNLSEESYLGKVTASNIGYFGQIGVAINLTKAFVFDINAKYSLCDVKISEIKNNIGGIRIGMGIGLCF